MGERFQEKDGVITEIQGGEGVITVKQRFLGDQGVKQNAIFVDVMDESGKFKSSEIVVMDSKRKRIDDEEIANNQEMVNMIEYSNVNVSKNGPEADVQGQSGGLALLWRFEGGCKVVKVTRHFIDFEVENIQVGRWRYTGFYGCPERRRRRESWGLISYLANKSNLPWCILRDFNDMMYRDEKMGGRDHTRDLLLGFTATINDCGLRDLGFVGEKYTWERSRGKPNWIQERLDRGFADQRWQTLFPLAEVLVIEVATSDHLPLFLSLNKKVYEAKGHRFRFENIWLREKECMNVVRNGWDLARGMDVTGKIQVCAEKLQQWGGGLSNEYKAKIHQCRLRLKKLRSWRDCQGIQQYNATRRKNNKVDKIKDANGVWQEEKEDIQRVIEDYFSELFTASNLQGSLSDREVVKQVSDLENEELLGEITGEEVKEAIFSMHPDKASGIDGFNPAFYQAFWSVVEIDVVKFCHDFMQTGLLPEGVNKTLVCLIPKVKIPQTMGDLRPISLCNVLVRILSKVLSIRLKRCLGSIISENQSAFIEGRLLTDNALITFEINHYMKRHTQGKVGVAGFKIDVSKAYDRLEWDFISSMMKRFGFNQIWIHRIMYFISSVS
ncbi:uncharacterized protein LOC141711143 [Apium graveolens]|uniref:uncharacterized protein LOC141711143 n=1 Tax=Apium graveolens TaxID=4045 RepID=UPI003D79BE61